MVFYGVDKVVGALEGSLSGGMQYELPSKVYKLIKDKFLREIKC